MLYSMLKNELPLEEIAEVCREHAIITLSSFGSLLTDRFDPDTSDADFVADFGKIVSTIAIRNAGKSLADILGVEVDVISARALERCRCPIFREEVERTCEVIYDLESQISDSE